MTAQMWLMLSGCKQESPERGERKVDGYSVFNYKLLRRNLNEKIKVINLDSNSKALKVEPQYRRVGF